MSISDLLSSSQITSLIQQATTEYQAPATALQDQEQPIESRITALTQVQSSLAGLQSALSSLANIQSLAQRAVSVSPSGSVRATADNTAATGTYSISGITLAAAENLISSGSASASGTLGAGTLTIQVGSGSAVNVDIASGQSSLAGIASAIDEAGAGIEAAVVFDGAKYHLVLTGDATGSANGFTISGTGALAGLSYYSGVSGLGVSQKAANASFSLDGLDITSGSNTIAGVVQGVTLTLAASGSATITVSQNVAALDNAAQSLVSALNQTLGTIGQNASYSQASGAGPLFGNIGLEIIRTNLLNAITAPPNAGIASSSPYASLSSVGFTVTSGGTVTFDQSTFDAAAGTDYGAVAALFGEIGQASNPEVAVAGVGSAPPGAYAVTVTANSGGTVVGTINGEAASGTGGTMTVNDGGTAQGLSVQIATGVTGDLGTVTISQGVFSSLSSIVSAALASGSGGVTGQIGSLDTTISAMNQQISQLQAQANQETQELTDQFSVAQATLTQLQTVSSFLTTYFDQTSGGG